MCISGQTSLPQPSGGLGTKPVFGVTTTVSQNQGGSSLFGGPQTQVPSGQQPGGLLGNLTNQTAGGGLPGSQQNQQPTSSLFGGLNNAQVSQPQQGGGLFGSTLGHTQGLNQTQQNAGPFENTLSNQNKSSLFGTIQSPPQRQQFIMQSRAPVSIFSSSIGQQNQQQQTVPGVRISVNELRHTTRFNDLHEELQKAIEFVDAFILNKTQWQEQCEAANRTMEEICEQMPPDVEHCSRNLNTVQQALENDAQSIAFAKDLVKADAADAKLSFKVINNLKLPQQFHHTSLWSTVPAPQQTGVSFPDESSEGCTSRNLVEFFSKQASVMFKTLDSYKHTVAEVEAYLKGVEVNALQQMQQLTHARHQDGREKTAEDQVRELAAVLREFENGILEVALKVGGARDSVQGAILDPTF
ncbi:MAG: hypothetical protein Q9163_000532 [Psora crenata]